MTASNHSPYALPPDYAVPPLDLDAFQGRAMGDPALRVPQLRTYRYACDALGGFLDDLARAGLSGRTIVAATGDHATREFFQYPETRDLPWRDRVPFFLEVPPGYLGGAAPDLDRWAGHRDIFPTLAGLALSGARVYRSGEDLFLPPARPPRALARFDTVLSDAGAAATLDGPIACWSGDGELGSGLADDCRPGVQALVQEERALRALLDWNVRRQAIAHPRTPGGLASR
jgi:phosphoglycerol transferase MdoB-like AlkP superfamily enzyme